MSPFFLDNSFFGYTKITIEQPLLDNQKIIKDKKGNIKPDPNKRNYERVPLNRDIDEYYNLDVKPYLPDSWMDRTKDKVGYEINFIRNFFKFTQLRNQEEILRDMELIDSEILYLSNELKDGFN